MSNFSRNNITRETLLFRPDRWSAAVRVFHWGSAILLVIVWAMIMIHKNSDGSTFIALHKAFGVSLLLWMIARVIVRVISQSPTPVPMPGWQRLIAQISHLILYVLLFAMPITGILMTWYGGRSIDMFGLFELPSMLATDRTQARFFNDIHTDVIWPAIVAFTVLHILAALQHQFIKKDNILSRMK